MLSKRAVLILGVGPLPVDRGDRLYAPGTRTWQLASAAANAGFYVTLLIIEFGDFEQAGGDGEWRPEREEVGHAIVIYRVRYKPDAIAQYMHGLHRNTPFCAAVSTTDIMNDVAALAALDVPLWLDYLGDPFAEKQLQASVFGNDGSLFRQYELLLRPLQVADRFSAVSESQRFSLMGALSMAGRLNEHTAGEDLVAPAMRACSSIMSVTISHRATRIKGIRIPVTHRIILWTGGYNSWCDVDTLFRALEMIFDEHSDVVFVSTGGSIEGHNNRTFARFEELIKTQSRGRGRYHFLGWIALEELPPLYREADVAVVTEHACYEGELGARTRINDWLLFEVPVVVAPVAEVPRMLVREGLVSAYTPGDAAGLAEALMANLNDVPTAKERAVRAREWYEKTHAEAVVFRPLLEWLREPSFSGDRTHARLNGSPWPSLDSLGASQSELMSRAAAEADQASARPEGFMGRWKQAVMRRIRG